MRMKMIDLSCEYRNTPLGIEAARPRLGWKLRSEDGNRMQTGYRVLVSSSRELLEQDRGDLWDSGLVPSGQSVHVEYDGAPLRSGMRCWWKVCVRDEAGRISPFSEPSWWEMGLLDPSDWQACWIGLSPESTPRAERTPDNAGLPSPYLRKNFVVDRPVRRARLYATALGVYEAVINGKKAGDQELAPGWTDYRYRIQYQTYDITELLTPGNNTVGAILADGWYTGNIAIVGRKQYGTYPLLFLAQILVEYEDGSSQAIITDHTWKGNTGPILYSDMQTGEAYDARKEQPDWCLPCFNDQDWLPVTEAKPECGRLSALIGPPVRVTEEVQPVSVMRLNERTHIADMGQNMVGRIRLQVNGPAGTTVRMRFGEMLKDDGSLYTENLRTAAQTDYYVVKGQGPEQYEARFTFHGFRFVELVDYPGELSPEHITGRVLHSDLPPAGCFSCSDPLVNQLVHNITWSQRGNFLSIPTDCPQRDERMGWTGDAQIFARTACFFMDCDSFYTKYMRDAADAQDPSGAFTDVVPFVRNPDGTGLVGVGNAAWGDAGVIIPWTLYLCYGDTGIIHTHYEAMAAWIDYLQEHSQQLIRPDAGFGDWLSIGADTPKEVMGTAYFAYSTRLFAKMARVIGRTEDADTCEQLFLKIRDAFNRAFVRADGTIYGETQTCYLLALRFDLLEEELRGPAARHLVHKVEEKDYHLSTGFVGVSYLLPVLTEMGYGELAYRLLLTDTYPSWLYSIKNGATTIWERWNSYTRENGFGDVGMNSFNHYSLGSVGEWLFRYVAGIQADEGNPGYRHVILKPQIGGGLTFAKGRYESVYGTIESSWSVSDGELEYYARIPENTEATIYLPCSGEDTLTENGRPYATLADIRLLQLEQGIAVLHTGPGCYRFRSNVRLWEQQAV